MKNSININYIKWNAFRSFKDPQETGDLPNNGLFGIIGKNNTTTGSSGSGKTNFHYAISYAFGYCPVPSTELQSWFTKTPMQVELGITTPSGPVIIKRGQETSINIDGIKYDGARVVESKLRSVIGLPINLIEALTFRQQKQPGRFLSMTDGEKKDFLCTLLGLEDFEVQIDLANKKANEAEKEWSELKTIASTLSSQLKVPVKSLLKNNDNPKAILRELEQYLPPITTLVIKLKKELDSYDRHAPESYDLIKERDLLFNDEKEISIHIKQLLNLKQEIESKIGVLNNLLKTRPQNDLEKLRLAIKAIEEAICPTCEQEVVNNKTKLLELKTTEKVAMDTQLIFDGYKIELNYLLSQKDKNNNSIADFQKQLNDIGTKIRTIDFNITDIQMKFDKNISKEYEQALYKEFKAKQDIKEQLDAIKDIDRHNAECQKEYTQQLNAFHFLKGDILKVESRVNEFYKIMSEESDLASMLKSFLGAIFAEVLQEIAMETNDMLKQLPNVAATTIQFDTEAVSQKGKIRQEIKPIFYKNGESVSIKSGLSGGQFTSVELATDLAIGKIIAQRTGLSLNWLILDESFEGHDIPVKEACLELLRNAAKDKLIFVIDHATEVNAYFDKCIMIESNNDCSKVIEVV